MRLQKVLYVCLCIDLLFYSNLKVEIEDVFPLLNPYDACIANKLVNESQITVSWNVDDLKISHNYTGEVTKMITYLESIYDPHGNETSK